MRELALHLLDLVQNAVEAGADVITAAVVEERSAGWLRLVVSDNGCGMSAKQCQQVLDPFYTSRQTRRVGLGLALIQMSTSRCGGDVIIESTPGQGTKVDATWQWSHLDRPPLGNLAETFKVLLVSNRQLDLKCVHQIDDRIFTISIRELTSALGGIELTQPEVLLWLEEYLVENEQRLMGGVGE